MKIAITGAAGYLGKQIISKLVYDAKIKSIVAVDRVEFPQTHKKIKSVVCDVTNKNIVHAFKGCHAVVHLAFVIGDSTNRPALYRVNVDGSRNVFESAAKAGAKHLVVASSIAAYGYYPDNPDVITESHPLRGNPDNAYSDTKRLVELLLDDFEKRNPRISVIRFRPGVILGPNTKNNFRTLLSLPVWLDFEGDGPGFYSWTAVVHEDDLVDAFVLGIKSKKRGAYNLAVEPFVTREEILARTKQIPVKLPAKIIGKILDAAFQLKLSPSPASDLYYMTRPIPTSGKKAVRELGWKPKFSRLDAVEQLLDAVHHDNAPLKQLQSIVKEFTKKKS